MKPVGFRRQAAKALRKLPREVQDAILRTLQAYAETGRGDVKKLKGRDDVRLRVGNCRAIFIESAEALDVTDVGHRKDIYR